VALYTLAGNFDAFNNLLSCNKVTPRYVVKYFAVFRLTGAVRAPPCNAALQAAANEDHWDTTGRHRYLVVYLYFLSLASIRPPFDHLDHPQGSVARGIGVMATRIHRSNSDGYYYPASSACTQ